MRVEHEIEIHAAPDIVWAVTEEVARWPEWSPTMTAIARLDDGPFDVGSTARIKQPGLPEAVWTVTALDRGRSFTWSTRVRGITMAGTHEVHASGEGTRSLLRIETSGWVARLLAPLLRRSVAKAIARENHGLKTRCEAVAREQ